MIALIVVLFTLLIIVGAVWL
ncbi:YjcZ family sporulation protein [Neobacillus sp. PS3-40]